MPLKILSPKERRAYTAIPDDIDEPALRRYFVLNVSDMAVVKRVRGAHNRLGLAVQLGWLRWLGYQPEAEQLLLNPAEIGRFLAVQLNLSADDLLVYGREPDTWLNHQQLARRHLKWLDCGEAERARLLEWLIDQAQQHDQPRGLLKDALSYLRREKIARPGISTIEKLVVQARQEAEKRIEGWLHRRLLGPQARALDGVHLRNVQKCLTANAEPHFAEENQDHSAIGLEVSCLRPLGGTVAESP